MALNALGKLEVVFKFRDASAAGTSKAKDRLKQVGDTAVQTGKRVKTAFSGAFPALISISTVMQLSRAFARVVTPAIKLSDSMARLKAFGDPGEMAGGMQAFGMESQRAARAIGANLGIETYKLVDALTELSKKGIAGESALAALVPSARLARVAGMEVAEAAEVAAVLTKVWGFEADQLSFRMDQMTMAARKSRMNFDELVGVMTRSASGVAMALDQSNFEDFLHIVAATRDVSQSAAITGTQLKVAYTNLAKKADDLAGSLGVVVKQGEGMRDVGQIIFEAVAKGDKSFSQITKTLERIAGTRGMIPFIALAQQARQAMAATPGDVDAARAAFFKLRNELSMSSGELARLVEELRKESFSFLVDRLRRSWEQLIETMGPSLLGPIGDLIRSLTGLLKFMDRVTSAVTGFRDSLGPVGKLLYWTNYILARVAIAILGTVVASTIALATFIRLKVVFDFLTKGLRAKAAAYAVAQAAARAAAVQNVQLATSNEAVVISANKVTKASLIQAGALSKVAPQAAAAGVGGAVAAGTGGVAAVGGAAAVGSAAAAVSRTSALGRLAPRLVPLLTRLRHPYVLASVGILAAVIIPLLLAFGLFSTDVESLAEFERKAEQGGMNQIDRLIAAGDVIGASWLTAVNRSEETFKDAPAAIRRATIETVPIEKLLQNVASEQQANVRSTLTALQTELLTGFDQMNEFARRGEPIPTEIRKAFVEAERQFSLMFMRYTGGDKSLDDAVQGLRAEATTLRPTTVGTDMAAKVMDATLKGERYVPSEPSAGAGASAAESALESAEITGKMYSTSKALSADELLGSEQATSAGMLGAATALAERVFRESKFGAVFTGLQLALGGHAAVSGGPADTMEALTEGTATGDVIRARRQRIEGPPITMVPYHGREEPITKTGAVSTKGPSALMSGFVASNRAVVENTAQIRRLLGGTLNMSVSTVNLAEAMQNASTDTESSGMRGSSS